MLSTASATDQPAHTSPVHWTTLQCWAFRVTFVYLILDALETFPTPIGHHTRHAGLRTIDASAAHANAFWNSGIFERMPFTRKSWSGVG